MPDIQYRGKSLIFIGFKPGDRVDYEIGDKDGDNVFHKEYTVIGYNEEHVMQFPLPVGEYRVTATDGSAAETAANFTVV